MRVSDEAFVCLYIPSSFASSFTQLRIPSSPPFDYSGSFLHKFYLHCVAELTRDVAAAAASSSGSTPLPPVPTIPIEEDGAAGFVGAPKPSIRGVQTYPAPRIAVGLEESHLGHHSRGPTEAAMAAADGVGMSAKHASGPLHCTGEALYADDIPAPEDMLHGYLIMSTRCHARLVSIDVSPALRVPGVAGAFTHEDIVRLGGDNRMGPIFLDDVAFVPLGDTVEHVGQVLGIVVGVLLFIFCSICGLGIIQNLLSGKEIVESCQEEKGNSR